jgi:T5orf172 domain
MPTCGKCRKDIFEKFTVVYGYVYVLSNPAMPNLLKIGCTTGSLERRINQLTSATGVPEPFILEACFLSESPRQDEKHIHHALKGYRQVGREFFRTTLDEILKCCDVQFSMKPTYLRSKHGKFVDL